MASMYTSTFLVCALALAATVTGAPADTNTDTQEAAAVKTLLRDQECLSTPPTPMAPDMAWASKVGSWYASAGSHLHIYRTAADLAGITVEDLTPADLYYKSCMRFVWGENTLIQGFSGKEADIRMKPTDETGANFNFKYSALGLDGKATIVLTDNETFIMFYACWAQGQEASWAVVSTVPRLPAKTRAAIHKQAESMGFSKKQFTELRYESCEEGKDGTEEAVTEASA